MHVINYLLLYWKPIAWSLIVLILTCLSNKFFTLPITGFYLVGYIIILSISTTWLSFVSLQNFLQLNKPLDIHKLLKLKTDTKPKEDLNNVTAIKQLTVDIDRFYIQKWFIYISKDRTFNEESMIILEEILNKMVNVQLSIDNEMIIHGILNIYLKHVKEFRRSLKRKEKYSGKTSDLYRYSHMCSSSKKAKHYFIHQLTINLLNHFINWELGNSLPYHVLVSIISKKVTTYLLNLISNPEFLNYYILISCASSNKKTELNLHKYNRVKITQVTENGDVTPSDLVKSLSKVNLSKAETDSVQTQETTEVDGSKPVEKEKTPELDYNQFKSEEVKIYEPKSCKTWYDSYDLASVTLGQDILDIIGVGDSDKDVDTLAVAEHEKEEASPMASAKILLDEMKHMTTLEGFKTSMKPISEATANTIHNIKDFQESTVNTALHKIHGLHLQDEAAGVMEGLLDFGRTRIRKGLRLTGLQDSPPEAETVKPKKPITKMGHVKSQAEELETTWINPLQEELPLKSEVKPDTDGKSGKIPSILTQSHEDGSPEPEYEETADLATSIAKLRSLLEQKSSESNMSTPALSPMPPDDLSNKILMENEDGVDETDGVMPSFYKFCAKTATGVIHNTLNTIKTALPGNVADCDRYDGAEKWLFVEANSTESDLFARMNKLLCERKVFCTVDTAYEAIDSLGSLQHGDKLRQSNIQFEDELDDFEVKLPITKAVLDILCELLADTKDTSLTQEPVIKSIMLLFGNYIEETMKNQANYYLQYCCSNVTIPSESKVETLSLELSDFINAILSGIPDYFKYLVGEKALNDVANLFVSSLQIQKINQDMMMQIFEMICMKLMDGSKQLSPISA